MWDREDTEVWQKKAQMSRLMTKPTKECAPSEDSDQPGHPPSLIRVFAVCMMTAWTLSYPLSAQRRLWSDWADAQADLSLHCAHMPFCWFRHEAAQMLNTESGISLKETVLTFGHSTKSHIISQIYRLILNQMILLMEKKKIKAVVQEI